MRWAGLQEDTDATPALFGAGAVVKEVRTPEFRGLTFYEVRAKSILNEVPKRSAVPFRWTINPYRGCSHACVYCFARSTHTYLDLDSGRDFDSRIVVKVNAAERLRLELRAPGWRGEHVAMGTNVDCYQRAEGRYRLMRGILAELGDAANPFSILTKGALVLRDLDLLQAAAAVTDVSVNISVGCIDRELWHAVEPGTPSPQARLKVVREMSAAGIRSGVLMAPLLPYLSDDRDQIEATVRAIAEAGATWLTPLALHLRPGAREWFFAWLARAHPDLVTRYERMYAGGAYLPANYQRAVADRVRSAAARYGLAQADPAEARAVRRRTVDRTGSAASQPSLV